ncbi:MFS transporter [Pyrobaculum aerophilum]|uniref:MFS transporter n=1 Tax=Pyrobaculum aerophilum TaxID=13773 RepID=UPI0023F0CC39|nr:MFS transporter [Pyrobaculum aerophilum]MCX8136023.1 MFS transporter [Pyrobaculum aerophilum]
MNLFPLVLFSRCVYSLMWFFLAPVLPAILREFRVDPAYAGLLPAAFIIGAAVTQIPASYLGAVYGHDKVAGLGMLIFGVSSALLPLSPSWEWLLLLRAVGGVGAGLFFSTAGAVLIALRPRAVGSALGWYNASFNIGAFVGYYWGFVASAIGWRAAIALPGLLSAALGVLLLRGVGIKTSTSISRSALIYGLASFPFWGAVYAANNLTATWLHLFKGISEDLAGALSSAAMISGFFGGFVGRLYDRVKRKTYLLIGAPILAALGYITIPSAPLEVIPILVFLYGISFNAYITSVYTTASKRAENPASALAIINVLNMALGLHFSYAFSWLMTQWAKAPWLMLSALALLSAFSTYIVINRLKIY